MDHVGHSRGSNSWVILVDHFCGSNLWVILVGHSRGPNSVNTVAIATTLGDYDGGTGPSQTYSSYQNQLVIFSLLNNSLQTCTISGLNWIRNCQL